jgi:hypothetical protein
MQRKRKGEKERKKKDRKRKKKQRIKPTLSSLSTQQKALILHFF